MLMYYAVLAVAVNSVLTISDYYGQIMALDTPHDVDAAVSLYNVPGKGYYLPALRTTWSDADNAKKDAQNFLLTLAKEAVSNLQFSSYCKNRLRTIYSEAARTVYDTNMLLEKDVQSLESMGVNSQNYTGAARPVYENLVQTLQALENNDSVYSPDALGVLGQVDKPGPEYFNRMVGSRTE